MDQLLRWSIENSGPGDSSQTQAPVERKEFDPAILDHILGRPDSELMKEAIARASEEERNEDERVAALDELEMLVEHIDNANDLEKLKLWGPLQKLLISSSSSEDIKIQTLWVMGTAMQNNPAAQSAYLSLDPLSTVISFLSPSTRSPQLRSKAVYALSSLLKHNAAAVDQLDPIGGWDLLCGTLKDSDIAVRRKTAFLLNTLLIPTIAEVEARQLREATSALTTGATLHTSDTQQQSAAPIHANSHASMLSNPTSVATAPATLKALRERGLLQVLVHELTSPTPYGVDGEREGDSDLEEKIVRLLHTYVTCHWGEFPKDEKRALNNFFTEKGGAASGEQTLGLSAEELQSLMQAVA